MRTSTAPPTGLAPPSPLAYEQRIAWVLRRELDMAFRRRARLLLGWLGEPAGQRVLDAGCGRGFYLSMLRALGHERVFGVDLELAWLAKARRRDARSALRLGAASLAAMPFADGSLDAVLLSEVLEHLPDDGAALREAARVLRPGGVALVSVPHANFPFSWDPLNRALAPFGAHIGRGPLAGIWAGHLRLYTQPGLRRTVEGAGLVVEEERSFVRRSLPLAPLLLYGIGKPLVEVAWLGHWLDVRLGRGSFAQPDPGMLNPYSWLLGLLTWVDRSNRDAEPAGAPTVNLALKARKP